MTGNSNITTKSKLGLLAALVIVGVAVLYFTMGSGPETAPTAAQPADFYVKFPNHAEGTSWEIAQSKAGHGDKDIVVLWQESVERLVKENGENYQKSYDLLKETDKRMEAAANAPSTTTAAIDQLAISRIALRRLHREQEISQKDKLFAEMGKAREIVSRGKGQIWWKGWNDDEAVMSPAAYHAKRAAQLACTEQEKTLAAELEDDVRSEIGSDEYDNFKS